MTQVGRTHCDRHPRFLAALIVDCENYHRLCISCIRTMAESTGGRFCPFCHHLNSSATSEQKLLDLVDKLSIDSSMTKPDLKETLPMEMLQEIMRFQNAENLCKMLPVSECIYHLEKVQARKMFPVKQKRLFEEKMRILQEKMEKDASNVTEQLDPRLREMMRLRRLAKHYHLYRNWARDFDIERGRGPPVRCDNPSSSSSSSNEAAGLDAGIWNDPEYEFVRHLSIERRT